MQSYVIWKETVCFSSFGKQKNVRIRKIRTQDTRYHPTFACGEYTTGALTADDALIAKRKKPWGGKIGALDNGSTRLFLRI